MFNQSSLKSDNLKIANDCKYIGVKLKKLEMYIFLLLIPVLVNFQLNNPLHLFILLGRKVVMTLLKFGFPCGLAGKEFACNAGDLDSIPGLGRSPGEGKGYPLQSSGQENSMDYTVHGLLLARILEWVAFSFSRGSSQPMD